MGSQPLLDESDLDLLVSHAVEPDESMGEAIVAAFLETGEEVFEKPSTLEEWIDTEALEQFDWDAPRPFYVSSPVWNRQVVVTPDEVRLYRHTPVR